MSENDEPEKLVVAAFRETQRNQQLLSRRASMLSYDRYTHTIQASIEILNPCRDSILRRTQPRGAIVNLVATICGGGVLSLPFAFEHAGMIPGTALMIFAAIITDFSLYILCSCARRTGGRTYADVALVAFGPLAEMATSLLLFFLLLFFLIAYIVLVKDVWTPILLCLLPAQALIPYDVSHLSENEQEEVAGDFVSLLALTLVGPFLLKRDLHGLRHTCYVGLCSACLLALAIVIRAAQRNISTSMFKTHVKLYATSWADLLFAFPIIVLSFMCCYNVLAVHGALVDPSRERLRFVIDGSMMTVFCLFYTIGMFGYLCAYEETQDNIFLNFDMSDHVFFLGRAGYAVTLTLAMPLAMLPCREALLSLPEQWHNRRASAEMKTVGESSIIINGVNFDEELPLLSKAISEYDSMERTTTDNVTLDPPTCGEYLSHVGSTVLIITVAYVGAIAVPGVAIVWSICGSFMAIIIAFFIPSACYLKIRHKRGINPRIIGAACLLVFSGVACVACTAQTVWRILQ